MTFSNLTFTSDQRFRCIHVKNSEDWTLQIDNVSQTDAGVYECQVSTETKLSLKVYLRIIGKLIVFKKFKKLNLIFFFLNFI